VDEVSLLLVETGQLLLELPVTQVEVHRPRHVTRLVLLRRAHVEDDDTGFLPLLVKLLHRDPRDLFLRHRHAGGGGE
jgi:hypothetical protein